MQMQRDLLTVLYLPSRAQYLNPNESKENQYIKSDLWENTFYTNIEEQKKSRSEYLDMTFGMSYNHFDI